MAAHLRYAGRDGAKCLTVVQHQNGAVHLLEVDACALAFGLLDNLLSANRKNENVTCRSGPRGNATVGLWRHMARWMKPLHAFTGLFRKDESRQVALLRRLPSA